MEEGICFSPMLKTFMNLDIYSHVVYNKSNTVLQWDKSGFLKTGSSEYPQREKIHTHTQILNAMYN